MKEITGYIKEYLKVTRLSILILTSIFTALLIYFNYQFDIDASIDAKNSVWAGFYYHYLIFLVAFTLPYLFYFLIAGKSYFKSTLFSFLLLLSPAIFSLKIAIDTQAQVTDNLLWNYYWNQVIYWPARLLVLSVILIILWKMFFKHDSFFGLSIKNFRWKPYLLMLLCMIPLITLASTQADFLYMYPKSKNVDAVLQYVNNNWFYYVIHEIAYGTDFISVELFFRGFLILAFIKIAGKDAILPMACYYCTIHFGKPLGECISSYFGGILLGIVAYNTRSIVGGLIVHLGIAWLMEIGGYIGNYLK